MENPSQLWWLKLGVLDTMFSFDGKKRTDANIGNKFPAMEAFISDP